MNTKHCRATRNITAFLSAIMLMEQLAGTGAVIYAHAAEEAEANYSIEHNVTVAWDDGCSAEIILTNLADTETHQMKSPVFTMQRNYQIMMVCA